MKNITVAVVVLAVLVGILFALGAPTARAIETGADPLAAIKAQIVSLQRLIAQLQQQLQLRLLGSGNTAGNTTGNTNGNQSAGNVSGNTGGNQSGNTTGNTSGNQSGNATTGGNNAGNTAGNTTGNTGGNQSGNTACTWQAVGCGASRHCPKNEMRQENWCGGPYPYQSICTQSAICEELACGDRICDPFENRTKCPLDCSVCGDGLVQGKEVCDDGNRVSETACAYGIPTCTVCNAYCTAKATLAGPFCGDGKVTSPEQCDPTAYGPWFYPCSSSCKFIVTGSGGSGTGTSGGTSSGGTTGGGTTGSTCSGSSCFTEY